MYISIHIPKTAGTTLAVIFDHGANRRIFYDYQLYGKSFTDIDFEFSCKDEQELLVRHSEFLEKKFDFIHGHFHSSKYLDVFPNADYITCVRDPLKRLISHYQHVIDEAREDYWLYHELRSGNLDLVDLANLPYVGDLQSRFLSAIEINDYSHIFINEFLAESIYQFQLRFGFERNDPYMNEVGEASIPVVNKKLDRSRLLVDFSKSELNKAKSELEGEFALYDKAMKKFESQKKEAGY